MGVIFVVGVGYKNGWGDTLLSTAVARLLICHIFPVCVVLYRLQQIVYPGSSATTYRSTMR